MTSPKKFIRFQYGSKRAVKRAETLMRGKQYEVASGDVLALAKSSGCTAYDCEFVALAKDLSLPLITA
ncbi:MAG: VapC toxin family PIN domain ribonuclease, partial [bacterium]